MKNYVISYISNSGMTVLNSIEAGKSKLDVIENIKGSEGIWIILSCIEIN